MRKNYIKLRTLSETTYEKILLGTLGTLLANKSWFKIGVGRFFPADNFTIADLIFFGVLVENIERNKVEFRLMEVK